MTSISSRGRKALAALLTVSALGAAMAPSAASAHGFGRHGGYGVAGFAGGLLLGSALASPVVEDRVVYERRCWFETQRRYDEFGYRYYKRIRVCE